MLPKSNKKVVEGKRFSPVTTAKDSATTPVGNVTQKAKTTLIWPEFTDVDSEKWECLGKGKDASKTKSPVTQYFEDPEGKIELPPSLKVDHWKRPHEILIDKIPVIVENNSLNTFDLVTNNEHLHESEVMRNIIGQIIALWEFSFLPVPHLFAVSDPNTPFISYSHSWRPWEHLYALCKSGKGPHMPQYNPHGKYIVRLYFMGCWRKLIVDDTLPFGKDKLLLPTTTQPHELWPMLLTKALLKVASLNYTLNCGSNEIGEFNVLHTLTGWLPEVVQITHKNTEKTWQLLTKVLPEWKPEDAVTVKEEPVVDAIAIDAVESLIVQPSKSKESTPKTEKVEKSEKSEREHGDKHEPTRTATSRRGRDKDKDKDKEKGKDKRDAVERELSRERFNQIDVKNNENSGLMIFATHWTPPAPLKASSFAEMATASEKLRQIGLSYFHPHPVWISQSRTQPLEPQSPPHVIPNWQLIRPRKKKNIPFDEPQITEESTQIRCLELATAFLYYKINPVSIPTIITKTRQCPNLEPEKKQRTMNNLIIKEIEEENEDSLPLDESTETEMNVSATCSLLDTNETEGKVKQPGTNNSDKPRQTRTSGSEKYNHSINSEKKKKGSKKDSVNGNIHPLLDNSIDSSNVTKEVNEKNGLPVSDFDLVATLPNLEHTGFKKTWVDFELFCKSFNSLSYYHKPMLYQNNIKASDIRMTSALLEEKSMQYLFLDGLVNSELVVCYSSLSRWNECSNPKDNVVKLKEEARLSPNSYENSSHPESGSIPSLQPGQLVVEPYSWKSLVIGQPILMLRTTATRAVTLTLPPGRHVLKFMMTSPLGYSIHLSSDSPFIFGDEETIMNQCSKESCHFIESASQLILSFESCIENFHSKEKYERAKEKMRVYLFPTAPAMAYSKGQQYENFKESLLRLLSKSVPFNAETLFAWRAFFFDLNWKNTPVTFQQQPCKLKTEKYDPFPQMETNIDFQIAAVKIQTFWRGAYVRKIKRSRTHGTPDNIAVCDVLKKFWLQIKPNIEEIGLNVFRYLISKNPKIIPYHSFYKEDWHKISYTDYQGVYGEQPPETWFVVFREVFLVSEEIMVVPKLYVNLKTCFLRVINNDNGAEINKVFKQVSPFVYRKNKRGYTFIAEARSLEQAIPSGRWRLRLIGSSSSLLHLQKAELNTHLYIQDIKHYYIPSDTYPYFMSYSVKVTEDHLATLQMSTSKPDVQFQLTVLDHDEVVCNVKGKGHVVIPSIIFLKDIIEEEPLSTSSKESLTVKKHLTARDTVMNHKYKIRATVLHDSWPLVPIDWQFIQASKSSISNELRMEFKESETPSPNLKVEKPSNHSSKPKSNKIRSGKETKEPKEARPASLQFDSSRPHWLLRFVSDPDCAEQVEIKRDKSRAEEIRQMKKAWEEAEPGRAAKANQSHQGYLNIHLLPTEVDKELLDSVLESCALTTEPPRIFLKDRVPRIDLSPFMNYNLTLLERTFFSNVKITGSRA
ncbi:androglobin-like [Octopus vulgaris]|uniref:Androglobin-like n=1 Tax=Octopus vulgaris TaxID=6645 RepID=A0AA36BUF9_OCTVU|nr:androglobin-like [Octopus vulgaris]